MYKKTKLLQKNLNLQINNRVSKVIFINLTVFVMLERKYFGHFCFWTFNSVDIIFFGLFLTLCPGTDLPLNQ